MLIGCLLCLLVCQLAGCCLCSWFVGCLVGYLVAWFVGCCFGGWFIVCLPFVYPPIATMTAVRQCESLTRHHAVFV